jgi:hypothetical protein
MSKDYTLAGEAFFREMMHPEGRNVVDNRSGDIGGGSHPSNVVSFQDYKRQLAQRERPPHPFHQSRRRETISTPDIRRSVSEITS